MDQQGKFSDTMAKKVNGRENDISRLSKHAISYINVLVSLIFFNIVLNVVEIFNEEYHCFRLTCIFFSRSCFAFIEVIWQKKLPL